MIIAFALLGAIVGYLLLDVLSGGWLVGATIGALAGWILQLSHRLSAVERQGRETEQRLRKTLERAGEQADERAEPAAARPQPPAPAPGERTRVPEGRVIDRPASTAPRPTRPPVPTERPEEPPAVSPTHAVPTAPAARPGAPGGPAGADVFQKTIDHAKRWVTTGNVPVKVGVIVSLFGVAFLINEAVDRGFLVFPVWARLVLVALFGLILLVIGWRLRNARPGYALSMQGGGIAIIYLAAYAAFGLFQLLAAVPALLLLVVVTTAAGTLAVLQNSRALAVLGIAGGFMAPVLTSTGAGNHVVLFSYYAVLNGAIFGVSWFKAWRLLNVLGFLFTFVIGTTWGYLAYEPSRFASTEPFLVLFVLMYTFIPVLFASQEAQGAKGFVDGTLVFGTPVVGFGLQTQLVGDTEYGLAFSAIALAGLYVGIATYLLRKRTPELEVLTESFLSLGIVFLAITFPLALNARWTSVAWSLQGAAMIWLGVRQRRRLALAAGIALQLGAAAAYILQPMRMPNDIAVVNGHYLGAVLIAAAGLFSSWAFDRSTTRPRTAYETLGSSAFLVWGGAWWLGAGVTEIDRFLPDQLGLRIALIFVAATVWAAMLGAPRMQWRRLEWFGPTLVPAMIIVFAVAQMARSHPLAQFGWIAWPVALSTHLVFLRRCEARFEAVKIPLHVAGYWGLALVLAAECYWWLDRWTDGVWAPAATVSLMGALIIATLRVRRGLGWPIGEHWQTYHRFGTGILLAATILAAALMNLVSPGNPEPLPYLPVFNPLDVMSVFGFIVACLWYAAGREHLPAGPLRVRQTVLVSGVLGLFVLTMTVARTVHHWADVPFDPESLAASNVLQASLSIVWGAAALAGMTAGALKQWRHVWIGGAALMTVVVAKLFLVELGNSGTVTRIVSFLGVGILLLIVGYFAPVPPRERPEAARS